MTPPAVQVNNLRFSYPDGTPALNGISFSIAPGERVALVGPNGAGKSTLLILLGGLLQADGAIEIFGSSVIPKNLHEIRNKIGMVFQDPDDQLFCSTIFDDVAFGPLNMRRPAEEVRQRVAAALEQVGLAGFEHRSAFHLSGGEKKRVSLATALSMDVDILALDEPSSNLDPRTRRAIIRWLQKCNKTLVIATHDLDLAYETTNRTMILQSGRIMADGPTTEILTNRELLEHSNLELPLQFQQTENR
ncbi:MAG: ABC transporter ATP-binding protein [Candidatus Omnitrophota bacterium]|jgi:cobalt/nickel transport system ATP-binding protein|nr:MAG: ABC transporter ATP-binding protein [Candidatus Omnitrophota bacterium]